MSKTIVKPIINFIFLTFLLASCTEKIEKMNKVDEYPDIYPDYIGVTVPVGIAPLNFNPAQKSIDKIDVIVKGAKGGDLHTQGKWADFDIDEWHELF